MRCSTHTVSLTSVLTKIQMMQGKTIQLFLLFCLIIGCNNRLANQLLTQKKRLIEQFIASPETKSPNVSGKIIILKIEYCETFDCEEYFKGYEEQIQIYTREAAFVRGLMDSVVIESIDADNKRIVIIKHRKENNYKRESVEIKI